MFLLLKPCKVAPDLSLSCAERQAGLGGKYKSKTGTNLFTLPVPAQKGLIAGLSGSSLLVLRNREETRRTGGAELQPWIIGIILNDTKFTSQGVVSRIALR
jgi:hypothetical protein